MNPETIKQIQEALTPLANKIGQGTTFAYGIVVKQVYVDSLKFGLVFLLAATIIAVSLAKVKKGERFKNPYLVAVGFTNKASILLFSLLATFSFYEMVARIINPHFYAIQMILSQVR